MRFLKTIIDLSINEFAGRIAEDYHDCRAEYASRCLLELTKNQAVTGISMYIPQFLIFSSISKKFYFQLETPHGKTILESERFSSKSGCKIGIEYVRENAPLEERYQRKETSDGQYYFNLLAENNRVIGKSVIYNSKQGREKGIKTVMKHAPEAHIEDMTV